MLKPRIFRGPALALVLMLSPGVARPAAGAPAAWTPAEVNALAAEVPILAGEKSALAETLRRRGDGLLRGGAFTILAIGDSVTATGPYPEILACVLERATGNENIRVVRAVYPRKSTDAALRRREKDIAPVNPDLALVMFGLNDQRRACRWHRPLMRSGARAGRICRRRPGGCDRCFHAATRSRSVRWS